LGKKSASSDPVTIYLHDLSAVADSRFLRVPVEGISVTPRLEIELANWPG
jgi:hypothetical protein